MLKITSDYDQNDTEKNESFEGIFNTRKDTALSHLSDDTLLVYKGIRSIIKEEEFLQEESSSQYRSSKSCLEHKRTRDGSKSTVRRGRKKTKESQTIHSGNKRDNIRIGLKRKFSDFLVGFFNSCLDYYVSYHQISVGKFKFHKFDGKKKEKIKIDEISDFIKKPVIHFLLDNDITRKKMPKGCYKEKEKNFTEDLLEYKKNLNTFYKEKTFGNLLDVTFEEFFSQFIGNGNEYLDQELQFLIEKNPLQNLMKDENKKLQKEWLDVANDFIVFYTKRNPRKVNKSRFKKYKIKYLFSRFSDKPKPSKLSIDSS